jgi:predicted dinucleotide-utilizing enzyme
MTDSPLDLTLIGHGPIGRAVAEGLAEIPGVRLAAILPRGDARGPRTPLTIDAAGPGALREYGARALVHGDLWSVGASALLDDALRDELTAIALGTGHRLRLFTGWILGPSLCPPGWAARLHVTQEAPLLGGHAPGIIFRGPLAEAARLFPDYLNTATAAALCGPGVAATRVTLRSNAEGGAHRIATRFEMPGQTLRSEVRFDRPGPHPVASALLAALTHQVAPLQYG